MKTKGRFQALGLVYVEPLADRFSPVRDIRWVPHISAWVEDTGEEKMYVFEISESGVTSRIRIGEAEAAHLAEWLKEGNTA